MLHILIYFQGSWSVGGITAALNAELMLCGNSALVRVMLSDILMHQ